MKTTATKSLFLSATALLTAMAFTSCSKESELDTIKDAQMCLNDATNSTAQACVSKLSGINTPQANQLKCAAYFIAEGKGQTSDLLAAVKAAEGGSGSTVAMISLLSFPGGLTASTAAAEVCSDSGIAVYSQLSSLVQIATLAKDFNPAAASEADYEAAITAMPAAPLGALAVSTYESSCSGQNGSGEALEKFCGQLEGAIDGASDAAIGECLKYKMGARPTNPGAPCPNN